jgi:hypothetical protein
MKAHPSKNFFVFVFIIIISSCFRQFAIAQNCKPGYTLSCDASGNHCKCVKPGTGCPRTGCLAIINNKSISDASLDSTVIHPSAIIEIKKTEPNMMKNLLSKLTVNGENELTESFRNNYPGIKNNLLSAQNNSLSDLISPAQKSSTICPPVVQTNFEGNPLTPFYLPPVGYYTSESNIAISNAGKIVSISNGWLSYYNENGILTFSDSLYHFGNSLIDVHVMYDPKKDRFVFISSYGFTDFVGTFQVMGVVVAFSKTNDPMDGWNLYFLPDSLFKDNCSSDYPQLGLSNDEVFITELRLNKGGNINQSVIVQMDKNTGYAGNASINPQVYNVQLSSSTKGPIEPVSGGSTTYGPNMYFMMAYESGNPSDKYYVFEITNTIVSAKAVMKTYGPVHSNISYSGSGVSYQPGGIALVDVLNPNDVSVNGAFYENGLIQFCQITNANGKAAINIGRIRGIPNNLSCTAKTVSDPNLYLSFPSIAYAGNSSSDNSAIVGIEHTGTNTYPGLSAVYVNSNFEVSALTTVRAGNDTINALWGDYSGICRRYNHPGECWFEGQYGSTAVTKINWIAKLQKPSACPEQNIIAEKSQPKKLNTPLTVFPNPFSNSGTISFTLSQPQKVSIKIYDVNGRLIKTLSDAGFEAGSHTIAWDTKNENGSYVFAGIYFLKIQTGSYTETKKIVVEK